MSLGEPFPVPLDLLGVPVLLGEDTAAVLLHIEAQLPGLGLPLPEAGAEIPVEEPHAIACRERLSRPADALVVLVGADQEGGGEVGEAVFRGEAGGLLQAGGVAVGAPVLDVPRHRLDEAPQAVLLPDRQVQADGGGVVHQGVPPGLVLLIGVDVGVIPESGGLDALVPKAFHTVDAARRTADVEQEVLHSIPSFGGSIAQKGCLVKSPGGGPEWISAIFVKTPFCIARKSVILVRQPKRRGRAMKKLVLGVLAHVDAGKTTLSEALLYTTGSIRRLGRVDHRDAFLDTEELERERGITIFSKQAVFPLEDPAGDVEVTLLDTPGHVDFSAEMERVLEKQV